LKTSIPFAAVHKFFTELSGFSTHAAHMVFADQFLSRTTLRSRRLVDCATRADNRFYKGENTMCGLNVEGGGSSHRGVSEGKSAFEGIRSTEDNGTSSVASDLWRKLPAKDCGPKVDVDVNVDVNVDVDVNNNSFNRDGRPFGRGLNDPHIALVRDEFRKAGPSAIGFEDATELWKEDHKDKHKEASGQFEERMGGRIGEEIESAIDETAGKIGKTLGKGTEGEWKGSSVAGGISDQIDFGAAPVERAGNALEGFRDATRRLNDKDHDYIDFDLARAAEGYRNAMTRT
jgi:hypothetical protein